MRTRRARRASALASLVLAALGACGTPWLAGCGGCDGAQIEVRSPEGSPVLEVCAAEARAAEERMRGLRGRDELAPDRGLLLVFPVADEVCITNEGVAFPIDEVFVDGANRVTAVERSVAAGEAAPRCHADVQRVLEVAGGAAGGVQPGDLLVTR